MKKTDLELRAALDDARRKVPNGSIWIHVSGSPAIVVIGHTLLAMPAGQAFERIDATPGIRYVHKDDGIEWTRPIESFLHRYRSTPQDRLTR